MKKKIREIKIRVLQKIADFIYIMLEINIDNEYQFDYWMWRGLNLNYWCVKRGIYLN